MSILETKVKKYYLNKDNISSIIPLITARIKEIADPEKIILFGSYASNSNRKDSDIDLIVIEKKVASKRKESLRIHEYLSDFIVPMDIIVTTSEEFDYYSQNWINSVFAEAKRNGTILYERI